jgi:hypothetical protein
VLAVAAAEVPSELYAEGITELGQGCVGILHSRGAREHGTGLCIPSPCSFKSAVGINDTPRCSLGDVLGVSNRGYSFQSEDLIKDTSLLAVTSLEYLRDLSKSGWIDSSGVVFVVSLLVENWHSMEVAANFDLVAEAGLQDRPSLIEQVIDAMLASDDCWVVCSNVEMFFEAGLRDLSAIKRLADKLAGEEAGYTYADEADRFYRLGLNNPADIEQLISRSIEQGGGRQVLRNVNMFVEAGVEISSKFVLKLALAEIEEGSAKVVTELLPMLLESGLADPNDIKELVNACEEKGSPALAVCIEALQEQASISDARIREIVRAILEVPDLSAKEINRQLKRYTTKSIGSLVKNFELDAERVLRYLQRKRGLDDVLLIKEVLVFSKMEDPNLIDKFENAFLSSPYDALMFYRGVMSEGTAEQQEFIKQFDIFPFLQQLITVAEHRL